MKKIIYTISDKTVWAELLDTKYNAIMNFKGIYKGTSKKDCEAWLKEYRREHGLTRRNTKTNKTTRLQRKTT